MSQLTPLVFPANTQWNEGDAAALRTFLNSSPKFLFFLQQAKPKAKPNRNEDDRAAFGSEIAGADKILDEIARLYNGNQPDTMKAGFLEGGE